MKNNQWFVLTGAPSSGKTTILKQLEKKGYKVIYELARTYIDEEIKKGKTIQEIRKDELAFQKKILNLKIDIEKELNPQEIIFFERGIHDSIAYYEVCNVVDNGYLHKIAKKKKYKKVFLLELPEYKVDYARTESPELAQRLEKLLEKSYSMYDIPVSFVPKLTIEERITFILNAINE